MSIESMTLKLKSIGYKESVVTANEILHHVILDKEYKQNRIKMLRERYRVFIKDDKVVVILKNKYILRTTYKENLSTYDSELGEIKLVTESNNLRSKMLVYDTKNKIAIAYDKRIFPSGWEFIDNNTCLLGRLSKFETTYMYSFEEDNLYEVKRIFDYDEDRVSPKMIIRKGANIVIYTDKNKEILCGLTEVHASAKSQVKGFRLEEA